MQTRILIVEDDLADARLLEMLLKDKAADADRFAVTIATRLHEAAEMLLAAPVDIVLLDINLPDSEGLDTLSGILAIQPDVPVIVVTAHLGETLGEQAVSLGAQDYLSKGTFDGRMLRRVVRYAIERQNAQLAEREHRLLAEALVDSISAMTRSLDLDQVLDRILENVSRVVPHDGARVLMIRDTDVAYLRRERGFEQEGFSQRDSPYHLNIVDVPLLLEMAQTGEPAVVADLMADPRWVKHQEFGRYRAWLGAPILQDTELLGFIDLENKTPGFYTESHARHLKAFADQAAIAIGNARLFHELETYNELLEIAVKQRTEDLQDAKDRAETILNSSPDAILLLKPDGRINTGNRSFEALFGYDAEKAFNQSPASLVTETYKHIITKAIAELSGSDLGQSRLEVKVIRGDGKAFDAEVALASMRTETTLQGFVCSIRDITPLKEVERMKDAFVSNVSHELRTPIASFKIYTQLLLRDGTARKDYIEKLQRETNRLEHTVEDLLRLSRLEQGRVTLSCQPLDLEKLAQQMVIDRVDLASQKQLTLTQGPAIGEVATVNADRGLIEQALSVLLTNAINYTPVGGSIAVQVVSRYIDQTRWVGIAVSDTGVGIPPQDRDKLFDRFYRGSVGRQSGTPGTGLGLAIVKEIMTRHQGSVEVESENIPGKGSTFTLWLSTNFVC